MDMPLRASLGLAMAKHNYIVNPYLLSIKAYKSLSLGILSTLRGIYVLDVGCWRREF